MSTTLDVATCPTNGRALSTNDDNLWALRKRLTIQLTSLNTCVDNSSTTIPIAWATILLQELDILETVRVDNERAVSS